MHSVQYPRLTQVLKLYPKYHSKSSVDVMLLRLKKVVAGTLDGSSNKVPL
jgi:hypothetical protein